MAVSKAPWTYPLSQAKATESPSTTKGPVMEVLMNLDILLLPKHLVTWLLTVNFKPDNRFADYLDSVAFCGKHYATIIIGFSESYNLWIMLLNHHYVHTLVQLYSQIN